MNARRALTGGVHARRLLSHAVTYVLLIAAAIFFLLPVYVLVATSLKSYAEVNLSTMWNLPGGLSLDSFREAWLGDPSKGTIGLSANFWNSVKLVIPGSIISTFLGSINGYILAKWKFRGADVIFPLILFGMFIPYQSVLIPLVSLLQVWTRSVAAGWIRGVLAWQVPQALGWLPPLLANYIPAYGTLGGLVMVHVIYGIPITTLIFRNYYAGIPNELVEASKIDGAHFFGIYRYILFPLSVPAFVVVLIWQFTSIWNEFLFAVVITSKAEVQPITVALNNLAGSVIVQWNVQMAGALMAALPTLLVYLILGRYFMRGLLAGALKG
ncbi:MAG: carbohydrate ABC transporter permease [Chloroflexi bacterium]|nr:carbohydrate ABC transporter permease [Chloroflexota bacterium]